MNNQNKEIEAPSFSSNQFRSRASICLMFFPAHSYNELSNWNAVQHRFAEKNDEVPGTDNKYADTRPPALDSAAASFSLDAIRRSAIFLPDRLVRQQ